MDIDIKISARNTLKDTVKKVATGAVNTEIIFIPDSRLPTAFKEVRSQKLTHP
ncbi:hypothetical protein [Okeania sp. SIO1I7]|uniref:hypothetical protein n=1 Tax=Okeania sp. SIO1I7 TaxID=2607772 RepID=UPI0025D1DB00|nr:hypothetical protein [Okeania sp. SIO1I7]